MAVWVALLRGVNVGGHRAVPMAELRAGCEQAGLADVRTYIASGNIVFAAPRRSADAVRALLEAAIAERFGFTVDVVVRSGEQLRRVVEGVPFDDLDHTSVSFLLQPLDAAAAQEVTGAVINGAQVVVGGDHAYLLTPKGLGTPWLTAGASRQLAAAGTVRNWRTVNRLLTMADETAALGSRNSRKVEG